MMQPSYRTPEEHIDWIRKEKFGLPPDGTLAGPNPLAASLQRAIKHLSEGLYSKETHFILELIQNAEDNHYRENVKPNLTFILLSRDPTQTPSAGNALLVINDEAGFRPEDVDALCDLGATTKTKREGYVGEKGIGFKSVFVVSSQPHVFSAGYQFRFQEEPDPRAELGYIVPYWVSEIPPEVGRHSSKTCIVLPLKHGKQGDVVKELETIAPETILFLSKLEGLTIQIGEQKSIEVIRDDTNRPLVQFVTGDQYVEFWVVEQEVPVPSGLHEEKREGIVTREVSVALPLTTESGFKERVFAFLPTKVDSGFPFLINADFILSTSREGIQFDRPWNHWLRDCIAPAFIQAFESLLDEPKHRARAYSYIPLTKDDQEEFFQPTVKFIYKELNDRAVIWTFDGEMLVKPAEARLVSPAFRKLLNSAHIPTQLQNTALVHPQIQTYRRQLQAIGVEDLSFDEITECLRDETWLEAQDLEWFTPLYEYLSQQQWATEERLRGLNLLPLEGGGRSSATEQPVYFPGEDAQEIRQLRIRASSVLDVAFLNPKLYESIRDDQKLTRWLMDTLRVRQLTMASYCIDLAQALNEHRGEVSVSELVRLTAYIRDQFDVLDDETQQAIIDALPLVLAGGEIVEPQQWDNHPLVVPEAMDPETGWQLVFADPDDRAHITVLSDAYLAGCEGEEEFNSWRNFFKALGATDAPPPMQKRWEFYSRHSMPKDITSRAREFFATRSDYSTRGYRLQDWIAPHWLQRLGDARQLDKETERRSFALLRWLERQPSRWGKPLFYQARYEWHYYSWQPKSFDSEFMYCLQNAPWFPSTQGPKRPGEVFLDKPELRELLGDAFPYARGKPSEKVASWLELRQMATVGELLQYLKGLTSRPADQDDQKRARKIYGFFSLSEPWRAEIKQQFEECPLILVSKPEPRWVTAEQAVWRDLSDVFGETYVYLETQYAHRFKEFFVEKVGVAEQLSQELFAKAWTQLASSKDIQADAVEAALERIYPELLKVAKEGEQPQWWQEFCTDAEVWTQNDRFESADRVYVPDDGELKKLFAKENVEFAWRPEKASFADYEPLYGALRIRSLVEAVQASAEVQQVAEVDAFQPLLTLAAKRAICFYLWNTNRNEYERAKQNGVLEALLRTREQMVRSLTVSYELDGIPIIDPNSGAYWQQDEYMLHRSDAHSQDQLEIEIPAILARRMTGGRSSNALEDFIGRVLSASEVKAEGIIGKHNWSLPAEERKWMNEILTSLLMEPEPEPEPIASGSLYVRSEPPGATIYVDGEHKGQTPLSLPNLAANRHYTVRAELDEQVKEKEHFLSPGLSLEIVFDFSVKPPPPGTPATLTVNSFPQGAKILIDGHFVGETPLQIEMDSDKSYVVQAELDGQVKSKRVLLVPGEETVEHFEFGSPPQPFLPGTLIIQSEPPGAMIWVNDVEYGEAPVTVSGLRGGSRPKVVARLDSQLAIERFTVPSGGTARVTIRIPKEQPPSAPARLTVYSDPEGASVWIDGFCRGQAPVTVEDLAGNAEHTIEVQLAGQRERETLWLAAGDDREITIKIEEAGPTTKQIERRAIEKYVIPYEKLNDRTARDVSEEDRGYDIYSEGDGVVRCIEVKSSRRELTQVAFTDNEWQTAEYYQDDYYLYVVARVNPNPDDFVEHITEYRNPYERFQDIAQPKERVEYVISLPQA
ncbi:MAG: PEGA domain-containing protein [Chloroflexi bacterium]|nr:PEGA domain-containing protein [Chloroflexota bacterium]